MENNIKKFRAAIFGIALICFFLPFFSGTCADQKIITINGIELMFGKTLPQNTPGGKNSKSAPEPLAILAFLCTAAGLGFSYLKGKEGMIATSVAGGAGMLLLLALKAKVDDEVYRLAGEWAGLINIKLEFGFWLVFFLFLSAIGLNIYLLQSKAEPTPEDKTTPPPQSKTGPLPREKTAPLPREKTKPPPQEKSGRNYKFCTQCGTKNNAGNAFCDDCGNKFS